MSTDGGVLSGDGSTETFGCRWLMADLPVETASVSELLPGDSPRLSGENAPHLASMLAASDLPPILVHKPTMRVIDGMHRLLVAKRRSQRTVEVQFFEGTFDEAFVVAVSSNISHGLPLSRNDRKAAAARILQTYPSWSDRRLASIVGLSHNTVAAIRRASGQTDQLHGRRLGKDGKARPTSSEAGRAAAAAMISADQQASLRKIAEQSGISPSTVRDVKDRLRRGLEPIRPGPGRGPQHDGERSGELTGSAPRSNEVEAKISVGASDRLATLHGSPAQLALQRLRVNPALRLSENGRALVRLLAVTLVSPADCQQLIRSAPEHSLAAIAEVASVIGDSWHEIASECRQEFNKAECG